MFVMDEADALLKDDFIEQIQLIYNELDSAAQVVIFSATYSDEIIAIAESITQEPRKKILMKYEELSLDLIKQYKVEVRYENIKYSTLADLYTKLQIGQCIIFVNSINTVNMLEKRLVKDGFGVSKIHGDLTTEQRTAILKDFRLGLSRVLLATDILSRGIDIEQIGIVINYDMPRDFASYIHRIGRSGRFGKIGVAINFVTNNDHENLYALEDHYKIKIDDMPSPNTINNFLSGVGGHLKLNNS
jgi:ATP-dependent RNA helicase